MNSRGRNLAALVLAAGASTRLGHPKQLVRYHGEFLVERAVRLAREAGADPVFVVLGANYSPIYEILSTVEPRVRVLLNQAWAGGMGNSLALGAAAAERDGADDLLVLTCDQVLVTAEHLRLLVKTSCRDHVVASEYAGHRGVPALFPAFSFHALQALRGDFGARDLLGQEDVLAVPLPGGDIDIDTPQDLRDLQEREAAAEPRALLETDMLKA